MLLEAMFRGEFYPAEDGDTQRTHIPGAAKGQQRSAGNAEGAAQGRGLPAGGAAAGAGLERPLHGVRVPLPLRLLRRAAARSRSPPGAPIQEAAMRVVKLSLKLLAIPILLMLLAVQWGLTFVVSLSGWIFHLLSGIIFATAILSGQMELCPWQEDRQYDDRELRPVPPAPPGRHPGDPVGGRGACPARVYKS